MNEEESIYDADIEETAVATLQPASLDRIDKDTVIANMRAQQEIFQEFLKYVKSNLEPKVDYYTVVQGAKPSLGQPGSEKILDFLRIYPKFVVTHRVLSRAEISYDVTCNLYSKVDGRQVGSGGGFCSSLEDNYLYEWVYEKYVPAGMDKSKLEQKKRKGKDGNWFTQYRLELQNHYNVANTVKKMALKRAMVDATVRSTFASHIFTQDLEDSYIGFQVQRSEDTPTEPSRTSNKASASHSEPVKSATDTKPLPNDGTYGLDVATYKLSGKSRYAGKLLIDCPGEYIEWLIGEAEKSTYKMTYDKIPMDIWIEFLKVCLQVHDEMKKDKETPPENKPPEKSVETEEELAKDAEKYFEEKFFE